MSKLFSAPQTLSRPRYISHRGFQPMAPANSLPSFEYAGYLRQWAIETDVHFTRDGVAVCCHNDTVDATFDGTGAIREMDWAELSRLRMNQGSRLGCLRDEQKRMPLFVEYLCICRRFGSVPFIELKTDDVKRVMALVRRSGFTDDEIVISAISLERVQAARSISKNVFVHRIFAKEEELPTLSALGNAGLSWNIPDVRNCTPDKISIPHEMGLMVCLRAGDTPESVRQMLELGCDYIPSNCMHATLQQKTSYAEDPLNITRMG